MAFAASKLYLLDSGHRQAILLPNEDGVPTFVDPQPMATRSVYIHAGRTEHEDLQQAQIELGTGRSLLVYVACPDGPPRRCALCFTFQRTITGPWQEQTIHHGAELHEYAVTTTFAGWSWLSEHENESAGYFLTGVASETSLWRVLRIEKDAFSRSLFTLSPIRLNATLVAADFAPLEDALLVGQLRAQYEDLARSVEQHAFRDVVTKAKNIIEGVIAGKLGLLDDRDRLDSGLKMIRKLLEDKETRAACGWTDLQYHVAQKIRLLHGRTHATTRTLLRPEFALSVVEDLNFLLREWGLVAG